MSLIHKALKKAEGERAQPGKEAEEHFIGGGNTSMPAGGRHSKLLLIILAWVVLGLLIYYFFLRPKGPAIEAPVAPVPVEAAAAPTPEPTAGSATSERLPAPAAPSTTTPTEVPAAIAQEIAEGEQLFAEAKFAEALAKFQAAAEKEPKVAPVWNNVGLAHKKLGQLTEAEQAYDKALELNGTYPEALNNKGTLKVAQGDNLSAALLFRKSIAADPAYADAHFNLALLMEEEGNWRSAVEEYKAFLTHTDNDDPVFRQRIEQHVEEIVP